MQDQRHGHLATAITSAWAGSPVEFTSSNTATTITDGAGVSMNSAMATVSTSGSGVSLPGQQMGSQNPAPVMAKQKPAEIAKKKKTIDDAERERIRKVCVCE